MPGVVYVHPWELDVDHPRVPIAWPAGITHYANLGSTRRKLESLLRDFSFGPLGEVFSGVIDGSP